MPKILGNCFATLALIVLLPEPFRAGEHTNAGYGQSFRLEGALSASLVPLGTLLRASIFFIKVIFPVASRWRNSPWS